MRPIHLSRSLTNPQHMSRLTIMFTILLFSKRSFIWQYQALMWHKHFAHMFEQVIMCRYRVEIPFAQFAMLRLSIFNTHIIYIVSLIIVDFLTIVHHKLSRSRFCILPCNPSYNHSFSWTWWLNYVLALVEKLHLVFFTYKKYFPKFSGSHVRKAQHSRQHEAQSSYFPHTKWDLFWASWFCAGWQLKAAFLYT